MTLLIFALTGLAIASLALGMKRHYTPVFRKAQAAGARTVFKVSGWLLLAGSFAVSALDASGIHLVAWFALLAFHGTLFALLIAYAPRVVPFVGALFGLLALLAAAR